MSEIPTCSRKGCTNLVTWNRSTYMWRKFCGVECAGIWRKEHNQQMTIKSVALAKKAHVIVNHGEPPECARPGCYNKVKWNPGGCWRDFCSNKCNRLCNISFRTMQKAPPTVDFIDYDKFDVRDYIDSLK